MPWVLPITRWPCSPNQECSSLPVQTEYTNALKGPLGTTALCNIEWNGVYVLHFIT